MIITPRVAVELWGKLLAVIGLALLLVGVPAVFVGDGVELTLLNVAAFFGYGVLSLGLWGLVVFVVGALPIALVAWFANAIKRRWGSKADR